MKMKRNRKLQCLVAALTVSLAALGAVSATAFADQQVTEEEETVYVLTGPGGAEQQRIVSAGGSLHYDGYEDIELPVTVKISYTLDGKKTAPEKMEGKDGRMVMTLSYENHTSDGGACVPFLVVSGMVLDHEHFSNIEVDGGRVTDDGDRSVVLGCSLPGVAENLGSAASKLDLPETVTVSADVKDFQMETVYSLASSEIFTELDLSSDMDLSDLNSQLDQLSGGVDQLMEGTGQLDDGAAKLAEGAEKVLEGVDTLHTGAGQLYEGTQSLKTGVSQLAKGTGDLKKGADSLGSGSAQLKAGADQLSTGLGQLAQSSPAVNAGAKQMVDAVFAAADQSLQAAGVNAALTPENYGSVLDQAAAGGAAQAAALKQQLDSAMAFYNGVLNYTAGVDNAAAGAKAFSGGIDSAAAGAKQLSDGAAALEKGQKQLSAGIARVDAGADKLYQGTKTLSQKERELSAGIDQLAEGAKALNKGVLQMSGQLADQLSELDPGQLADLLDGLKAMENAAKAYAPFGGEDGSGSVKFIFKAAEISSK